MLFPKLNFYCLTSMQNITLYLGGTFPEEKKIIIIDPIKPSDCTIYVVHESAWKRCERYILMFRFCDCVVQTDVSRRNLTANILLITLARAQYHPHGEQRALYDGTVSGNYYPWTHGRWSDPSDARAKIFDRESRPSSIFATNIYLLYVIFRGYPMFGCYML